MKNFPNLFFGKTNQDYDSVLLRCLWFLIVDHVQPGWSHTEPCSSHAASVGHGKDSFLHDWNWIMDFWVGWLLRARVLLTTALILTPRGSDRPGSKYQMFLNLDFKSQISPRFWMKVASKGAALMESRLLKATFAVARVAPRVLMAPVALVVPVATGG